MSKVGPQTVRHIAQLAQLELAEDRLEQVADELSAILMHMAEIAKFEVSAAPAEAGPTPRRRADRPQPSTADHLVQAPTQGTEVVVPQVKDAS